MPGFKIGLETEHSIDTGQRFPVSQGPFLQGTAEEHNLLEEMARKFIDKEYLGPMFQLTSQKRCLDLLGWLGIQLGNVLGK